MGEVRLQGIGVSRGVGIGTAIVLREEELKIEHILVEDEEKERKRFETAVSVLKEKNQELTKQLSASVGEKDAQIILAHNAVLEEPEIIEPILKMIKEFRVNGEAAVEEVFNKAIQTMSCLEDDRMKERVSDLEDVKQGLLRILLNVGEVDFSKISDNTIIVTKELSPHVSAMLDGDKIAGIITQRGGPTSHAAIISKAMEIPAVVGVEDAVELIAEGQFVVLDGENGTVILNPEEKTRKSFERQKKNVQAEKESLKEYIGLNSISKDGVLFEVQANVGSLQETQKALEQDAQG